MLSSPSDGLALGGSAFESPALLELVDAGGNRIVGNSHDYVQVNFARNPWGAQLLPHNYTLQRLDRGLAIFTQLSVDTAGDLYALRFHYLKYDPLLRVMGDAVDSDISIDTAPFTVAIGPPYKLSIQRDPKGAIAGGSALSQQPVVAITDVGGNVVTSDSESLVISYVVASPSSARLIRVDTSTADMVKVTKIYLDESSTKYGDVVTIGDRLVINVEFDQEVKVGATSCLPQLLLGFVNMTSNSHYYATSSRKMVGLRTNILKFVWQIPENFQKDVNGLVTHQSVDALILPNDGCSLLDNFGRLVNMTLPEQLADNAIPHLSNVTVNTFKPKILNMDLLIENTGFVDRKTTLNASSFALNYGYEKGSTEYDETVSLFDQSILNSITSQSSQSSILEDSLSFTSITHQEQVEVGAGHLVMLKLSFDLDVMVTGTPFLLLNISWSNQTDRLADQMNSTSSSFHKIIQASYICGSGSDELLFGYLVGQGDEVSVGSFKLAGSPTPQVYTSSNAYTSLVGDSSAVHSPTPSPTKSDSIVETSIVRKSDVPSLSANLTLSVGYSLEFLASKFSIDTSFPVINVTFGDVRCLSVDGSYYAGDELSFTVSFDKPIVATGLALALDTGNTDNGLASLDSGSGSNTLTFKYRVTKGDSTDRLNSLYTSNNLHTALRISEGGEGGSITRQSTIPVTHADISMHSSVPLQLNATAVVSLDGVAPTVEGAFIHAFMPSSDSNIYQKSDVDTLIKFDDSFQGTNATLGVGSEVFINITWSKTVTLLGNVQSLYVDVGKIRAAEYVSGNNTHNLQYKYTVMLGDSVIRSTSASCLTCYTGGADCTNPHLCPWSLGLRYSPNALNGDIRLLSTLPVLLADKSFLSLKHQDDRAGRQYGIPLYSFQNDELDMNLKNTSALFINTAVGTGGDRESFISSVSTLKSSGTYGAGENIYITVTFSDEVKFVAGSHLPKIRLNLEHSNNPYAEYVSGSGLTSLKFLYRIQPSDNTSALDWSVNPFKNETTVSSFFVCNGTANATSECGLVNVNGVAVNLTLAASRVGNTYPLNSLKDSAILEIKTTPPQITRIYSNKNESSLSSLSYTVGESIKIMVDFNQPIRLFSQPLLYVANKGEDSAYALPCQGLTPKSSDDDSDDDVDHSDSNQLHRYGYSIWFEYIVQPNDYSSNLSLATSEAVKAVTNNAENNPISLNYGQAAIKRDSNFPTTNANLTVEHLIQNGFVSLALPGRVLRIDTSHVPSVLNVSWVSDISSYVPDFSRIGQRATSSSSDIDDNVAISSSSGNGEGTFRPGDVLIFKITFDVPVTFGPSFTSHGESKETVDGGDGVFVSTPNAIDYFVIKPSIWLETGEVDRKAFYFDGDGTKELYFRYQVTQGDLSFDLGYVDVHSLEAGINAAEEPAHIYQVSSNPSVIADLTLPLVGQVGSLSYNNNLHIEGNVPYLTRISFVLPDFDRTEATDDAVDDSNTDDTDDWSTYATRAGVVATMKSTDVILLKCVFSGPVVVEGMPRIRMGLDDDDDRFVITDEGDITRSGDEDGDFVSDIADKDYKTGSYGSAFGSSNNDDRGGRGIMVRYATYLNGTNSTELYFAYTVRTGDMCEDRLDYYADERNFRTSSKAFDLSHGSIKSASFNPLLDADIHLNPAGGFLQAAFGSIGSVAALAEGAEDRDTLGHLYGTGVAASNGVATFEDLSIAQRGLDYRLNFECLPYDLPYVLKIETSEPLEVEYSCEFEVSGRDRETGDSFGHSVDVAGDLLIAGAPHKHLDVQEVQYVRTSGDAARDTLEIQIIGIATDEQTEIQSFYTTTDVHDTVAGSFRLSYDDGESISGETFEILHDAPSDTISVALQEAFPELGVVLVSREDYTWCACNEAYVWHITFLTATGDVKLLMTDGDGLLGSSRISEMTTERESPWLNGTFTLGVQPFGGDFHYSDPDGSLFNNSDVSKGPIGGNYSIANPDIAIRTRPIAVDAPASEVAYALEQDLGMKVQEVTIANENDRNGRQYIVTFASQQTHQMSLSANENDTDTGVDNDVLTLVADASSIGGGGPGGAEVWIKTIREGANRLWGSFTLRFREPSEIEYELSKRHGDFPSNTRDIPYNASAQQVEEELEKLGSIGDVTVTKEMEVGLDRGALWSITFNSVKRLTIYGWSPDTMDNLEPLTSDATGLHGTNRRVEVGYRSGGILDYPNWAPKRLGSFGEQSGVAYVFQRSGITNDQYSEVARLSAFDADQHDLFGWSVALSGGGRPWGKEQGTGVTTGFGGKNSGHRPIVAVGAPSKEDGGVLEQQLLRCLGDGGFFRLSFRGSTSDLLPYNITHPEFVASIRGSFGPCLSCHAGASADPMHVFPAIEVEPWEGGLCSPDTFWESQYTNWRPSGGNASEGALITFLTPNSYEVGGDLEMLQVDSDLLNLDGDHGGGNASVIEVRKGTSVSSGPNSKGAQKGAVYMFGSGDDNGFGQASLWRQHAKLVLPEGGPADRFGWAVSLSTDSSTLVASAPGEGGEIGAIYIYERNSGNTEFVEPYKNANYGPGEWVRTQRLDGSVFSSELLDQFGESMVLSPDGNTIVVGSPGYDNGKGAAYILLRNSYSGKFRMHQQLILENDAGVEGDRLGCSVAIDHHTVVVSACGRSDTVIHTGTVPSASKQTSSGAVYVWLREFFEGYCFFTQKLEASNVLAGDRFGYSVAVSNDTIIASSLAVPPVLHSRIPRHAVHKVTTSALSNLLYPGAEHVGSTFTLSWRSKRSDQNADVWERRVSSPIESDAQASELASILERDLNTGFVRVARTPIDADTGGYTWYVTFATIDGDASGGGVPLLEADGSMLTGTGASVTVTELNPAPTKVRGLVRAFTRPTGSWLTTADGHWKPFVEQAMLFPEVKQRQDLFGHSCALDGEAAAVGAPNRDSYVSFANGGSAFAYDLDFLRLSIDEEDPYEVYEGHGQVIPIRRSTHTDTMQVLKLESLDRNMPLDRQNKARDLFGLDDATLFNGGGGSGGAGSNGGAGSGGFGASSGGLFSTVADAVGAGSAYARSQFYGSSENKSVWVDGAFDYRGVSDYLPLSDKLTFYGSQTLVETTLNTTNDNIVEQPDENVTVAVRIPGMWASLLGSLSVEVVIVDDADGSGAANGYSCYEKLYANDGEVQDGFGESVAVYDDIAIIGAPNAPGTKEESGAVYVFRKIAGYWEQESRLTVPHNNITANADDDGDDGGGGYTSELGGEGASGRGLFGSKRTKFGESVAISQPYLPRHSRHLRPRTTVLVGAPGTSTVHVFTKNSTSGRGWRYDTALTHPEAVYPQHRFGARGSIAIHQDVAVVGASGLECVFLYRRKYDRLLDEWTWSDGIKLLSSDYDYDLILDKIYMHLMHFGISVGISGRTLAVGAPLADYGNRGDTSVRETFDTNGLDNFGVGRGKVYFFHSIPHQQTISLRSDTQLYAGTWRVQLDYRNVTSISRECAYDASIGDVKRAIEELDTVDEVEVSYQKLDNGLLHRWRISFLSENNDPPLLEPLWQVTTSTAAGYEGGRKAGGCAAVGGCINMTSPYTGNEQSAQMVAEQVASVGDWLEIQTIQAQDKNSGDRFGATLSLDNDGLVVGAPHSAAATTTTWDFETGDLIGWKVTGDAFDYQPTYGDNLVSRSVYGEAGDRRGHGGAKRANIQGRYFIGTYERRPGAGRGAYQQPHPNFPPGTVQGDTPTGTLTSEPFSIPDTLSQGQGVRFNIGGGCDVNLVYVELMIDGVGVDRVTGRCEEEMKEKKFDLSLYRGRAAQLRLVDISSVAWGHLNVDSFKFDWAMGGAQVTGRSTIDMTSLNNETTVTLDSNGDVRDANQDQKVHRALPETTPEAGAAYVFKRQSGREDPEVCLGDKTNCIWVQDAKLLASDRRKADRFGSAVAINDQSGTVIVGAIGATASSSLFGPRIPAANHPYYPEESVGIKVPMTSEVTSRVLMSSSAYTSLPSGLSGYLATKLYNNANNSVTRNNNNHDVDFDVREFEKAGSLYVYTRRATVFSGGTGVKRVGRTVEASSWSNTEQMRLSPPSLAARDQFGKSVAIFQDSAFVGIPGDDGNGNNVGAIAMFDLSIQRCFFMSAEFVVVEGEQPHVVVTIGRDSEWLGRPLTVSFATSDLTARGVDPLKYEECMNMPLEDRGQRCGGDYLQTAGEITFGPKDSEVAFAVFIINDLCPEHYPEFILLTMSIPGAQAVGGEDYLSRIRIDDDDEAHFEC